MSATHDDQVMYLGRWVKRENFRAFIHGRTGAKKLVNSWIEYEHEIGTGEWFSTIDEVMKIPVDEPVVKRTGRKAANGSASAVS